ncbi:hypothetical protein SASPL_150140 [Salvia splendens]|uniref:Uncharacterized protein n=1 Tax=Salvia splendens TaxID=180675 RepID=A0A8X8Z272_SALSN|nr:hypothetical protein SASPL_150140 [Salvia splendens]
MDVAYQSMKYGEDASNISVEEKSKSATTRQKEKLYVEEEDLSDVEEEDGFLQAFQVANFEYINEAERAIEEEISAPPPEGQASLNKLERASFTVYRLWDKYDV